MTEMPLQLQFIESPDLMTPTSDTAPRADCLTFAELFDDDRMFRIPDYQRAYAWEASEVKDLLSDIDQLASMREHDASVVHVMGMITCQRSSRDVATHRVVDGQQRLTTLALLHTELSRQMGETSFIYAQNGSVRLTPQAIDENDFYKILRGMKGERKTRGQKNYATATKTITNWINENTRSPKELKSLVDDGLSLILFTLRNEADVARVFEAINNRGRGVTQLDLVKNHLIHLAHVRNWQGNVQQVWSTIATSLAKLDISDDDADRVLRAIVTAQFHPGKRKSGETDANIIAKKLPIFGKSNKRARKNFEQFLSFIDKAFDTYSALLTANDTATPRMRALTYLRHHGTLTGVLPIILAHEFSHGSDDDEAAVLDVIEKVNFRLYGLPGASRRVDSHDVTFANAAHNYFCGTTTSKELIKVLYGMVKKVQPQPAHSIVEALTLNDDDEFDFYYWSRKWLRYFLARWEENLLEKQSFNFGKLVGLGSKSNDKLEVEHIWAQKQTDSTVRHYCDSLLVRRLGNLMLMPKGMNIQVSNHLPEIKTKKIHDMNISKLQQNERLQNYVRQAVYFADHLETDKALSFGDEKKPQTKTIKECRNVVMTKILCDIREEEMIHFALQAWKLDGEETEGCFIGLHSFARDGSTYRHNNENSKTKANRNYLLSGDDDVELARRHKARLKLLSAI